MLPRSLVIAGLTLLLGPSLFAANQRKISLDMTTNDISAINQNFQNVNKELSNTVHKTSDEIIRGNKYFGGPNPWIDVRVYGAVGNGITDDTTAIQNAINAVPTGGGTVFVPKGTYMVSATLSITSSTTLRGAGLGVSIIKQSSGANTDVLGGSGTNIVIQDISFDGNVAQNASGDNGISLNTIYKSRIVRVSTYNNKLKGISINAPCDDVVIDNTESYSNSQDGYAFASGTQVSGSYCKNVSLINSFAHDNTLYGVGIDTPDATYLRNVNTSIINSRFINNGTYGIEVFGAISPHIIGNYIEGSGNHGIDLGSVSSTSFRVDGAVVKGNTIKNQAAATACIQMQSIYNSQVEGNRCFDDQGSPTTAIGIKWNAGTGNIIANNDMSGVTTTPLDVGSSIDQIVYGNIGYNTDFTTHTQHINQGGIHITNASTGLTSSDGSFIQSTGGTTELNIIQKENDAIRFYTNNVERMSIDSTGRVMVGTNTATSPLEIARNDSPEFRLTDTGGAGTGVPRIIFDKADTGGATDWSIESGIGGVNNGALTFTNPTTANAVNFMKDGKVGIGTTGASAQLHTTGTLRFANFGAGTATFDASGNITSVSDERMKDIQGPFKRGLKDILKITPQNYCWKESTGFDCVNVYSGFIAQDVAKAIPEAAWKNKDGYYSFQDRPVMAAMLNAIKELSGKIDVLNKRIASLEAKK